jgi:hypothetical protein
MEEMEKMQLDKESRKGEVTNSMEATEKAEVEKRQTQQADEEQKRKKRKMEGQDTGHQQKEEAQARANTTAPETEASGEQPKKTAREQAKTPPVDKSARKEFAEDEKMKVEERVLFRMLQQHREAKVLAALAFHAERATEDEKEEADKERFIQTALIQYLMDLWNKQ